MADQRGFSPPAAPPASPGFPENPLPIVFDGFAGMNTKPSRPAIEDQQAFWSDGFMMIGPNNARTLPDIGDALYMAPAGSLSFYGFANIGDTPYAIVFLSTGSIVAVNTTTGMPMSVAPAGTIQNPASQIGLSQWGSQYVLICAPQTNGYFIWDGSSLFESGSLGPTATLTSSGSGYTSAPTVSVVGGSGSGATVVATEANGGITALSVVNPGSGYSFYDQPYLAFSGGGGNTTAILTSSISGGSLAGIAVVNGGSGYTSSASVNILGGGGADATATVVVSGGSVSSASITTAGEGFISAPSIQVADPNNTVAEGVVQVMPFGVQGTGIETYQGRVWIINGAAPMVPPPRGLVQFSAAGAPDDFSAADGAGSFVSTDSFLRVGFHGIKQSNGFLYLIGDSSLNYISNVQETTSVPPQVTFSNQNVDPQIGSPWPNTVQVFSRNVVSANPFGVHVSYGGNISKVSDALDGIYTTVPNFGNFEPSSAIADIFGIRVYVLLLPVIDPISLTQVNKLFIWDGHKWFAASQSLAITQIASQEINSELTAWATDGTGLYPMFSVPSGTLQKVMQSKLWDRPGYEMTKMALRLFGMVFYNSTVSQALSVSIDTSAPGESQDITISGGFVTIYNNVGAAVPVFNNADVEVTIGGAALNVFGPIRLSRQGSLIGLTVTTDAADMVLLSLTIWEQIRQLNL